MIVDVLPNHTAFDTSAVAQGLRDAVGGIDNLYHANGLVEIKDYNDRLQCTTSGVGGLPDVNTENPDFQYYYMQYVADLIRCGAGGFRYDTANISDCRQTLSTRSRRKTISGQWLWA